MANAVAKFFKLDERGTNVKTEAVAGTTTFLAMAYIIFVQPAVMTAAGMDSGAVMTATCIGSALICLIMGFFANFPAAGAPLIGENFFFAFTVAGSMGFGFKGALAVVLVEGIIFLLISSTKFREYMLNVIPAQLKYAMAAGIGLFIAFIGLKWAGIVVSNPSTAVALGSFKSPAILTSLVGIIVIAALMARKVKGAILYGIGASLVTGIITGTVKFYGFVDAPQSIAPVFMQFDFSKIATLNFWTVVFILLFMEMFDTIGTITSVGEESGLAQNGRLPGAGRVLFVDALGTSIGAILGTSTISSYIESNAGVSQGGRTGLSNVFTAVLFLLSLFFYPLVRSIGGGFDAGGGNILYPVTAPALIVVGFLMMRLVTKLDFSDITEAMPAFLILIGIPLTYSIADGIALGMIAYPVIKIISGRAKEVSWLMYVFAAIFLARYIFL
jgi:AGZA family xanthine/uracil permease-like MFS transporter